MVEAEYSTSVQTHCCLEPHAIVADWRADGLTVYMSTQFTAGVRDEIAETFGLPLNRVRVIVDAMGGGFGSKSSLGNYGVSRRRAVTPSQSAGASFPRARRRANGRRQSARHMAALAYWRQARRVAYRNFAGELRHRRNRSWCRCRQATRGALFLPQFRGRSIRCVHQCRSGLRDARAGEYAGRVWLEQTIDELAEKLGIDPLAMRDRIDPSPVRCEERRIGAERIGWSRRQPRRCDSGPIKRGLGVAQSLWGANVQTNAACEVRVLRDGSVEVLSSVQDIGTGIATVLAQTVAEVFGLRPDQITVRIGDTEFPPGGPSYGSRTTASVTPPARTAAWHVLQQLFCRSGIASQRGPR